MIAFDDIQPGMEIRRENGVDTEEFTVEDIDLEGGWIDTTEGRTIFRHDLDNSWVYHDVTRRFVHSGRSGRRRWFA